MAFGIALDFEIDATGFEPPEIDLRIQSLAPDESRDSEDEFEVPEGAPVSQSGDLWTLGKHRLLRGNALDSHAMARMTSRGALRAVSALATLSNARHVRKQREVLERHAHAARLRRILDDVAAAEQNAALVGLLHTGDKPEKQGLARPGRSENDHDFSILDRERDPVEDLARLELLADRLKLEFAHELSLQRAKREALDEVPLGVKRKR